MELITIKNYSEKENQIDWSKLSEKISIEKQPIEDVIEYYNDDDDIKKYVDKWFQLLNLEILQKILTKKTIVDKPTIKEIVEQSPNIVVASVPKHNTIEKKAVVKKQPTPKKGVATTHIQPVIEKKFVDNFSTEFMLIRRFFNIIKNENVDLEFRKAQLLYAAFNKAAVERKVRKTSAVADIFNSCNRKMKTLFEDFMLPNKENVKVEFSDKKLFNEIKNYVSDVAINPAVTTLKKFISIQNTKPEVKKVESLIKLLIKVDNADINNRLHDELAGAIKSLQDYIKKPTTAIKVETYKLSKPKVIKKKVLKKKVLKK
jgi:hypothetical protein